MALQSPSTMGSFIDTYRSISNETGPTRWCGGWTSSGKPNSKEKNSSNPTPEDVITGMSEGTYESCTPVRNVYKSCTSAKDFSHSPEVRARRNSGKLDQCIRHIYYEASQWLIAWTMGNTFLSIFVTLCDAQIQPKSRTWYVKLSLDSKKLVWNWMLQRGSRGSSNQSM